jgi:hypothetical protein
MATQHPRIGLTRDRELAAALELTRDLLPDTETRSEAGHVRRLALLGATALAQGAGAGAGARARAAILSRAGVRPATQRVSALPWLAQDDVDGERTATRALDVVRGVR